jgi:hypothetical protein
VASDLALSDRPTGLRVRQQDLSDEMLLGENTVHNGGPLHVRLDIAMSMTGRNAKVAASRVGTVMAKAAGTAAVRQTLGVPGRGFMVGLTGHLDPLTVKVNAVLKAGLIVDPAPTVTVLPDRSVLALPAPQATAPAVPSIEIPVRRKAAFRSDPILELALGARVPLPALIRSVLGHVDLQLVDLPAHANAQPPGERPALPVGSAPQRVQTV